MGNEISAPAGASISAGILENFPLDVLCLIADHLAVLDILHFTQAARVHYQRLAHSETLWRQLYIRDIGELSSRTLQTNYLEEYRKIGTVARRKSTAVVVQYAAENGYRHLLDTTLLDHSSEILLCKALTASCRGGQMAIVRDLLPRVDNWLPALGAACRAGNVDIVNEIFNRKDAEASLPPRNVYLNRALREAARGGHVGIINMMVARGANDWETAMAQAAGGGHVEIVKSMIDRGATDWNTAMHNATRGGHLTIMQEMINRGAVVENTTLASAARGGNMECVQELIHRGATDWNSCAAVAATEGHRPILNELIRRGANEWDWFMARAASGGYRDIVLEMIDRGATNWNRAMENAAEGGHLDIVRQMIERGANHWDNALIDAASGGHLDIVKEMIRRRGGDDKTEAFQEIKQQATMQSSQIGHMKVAAYLESL